MMPYGPMSEDPQDLQDLIDSGVDVTQIIPGSAPNVEPTAAPIPQVGGGVTPQRGIRGALSNPNLMMFALAMAHSLSQPRQMGESSTQQWTNGLLNGYTMLGLVRNYQQQQARQAMMDDLKRQQVDIARQRAQAYADYQKRRGEAPAVPGSMEAYYAQQLSTTTDPNERKAIIDEYRRAKFAENPQGAPSSLDALYARKLSQAQTPDEQKGILSEWTAAKQQLEGVKSPSVDQQKMDIAFQAYAQKVGKSVADLTPAERQKALAENAAATMGPQQKIAIQLGNARLQNELNKLQSPAEIADGIEQGLLPADLADYRRTGQAMEIAKILKRHGFDFAKANLDWQANKRMVATLNGPTITRMRYAVNMVDNSIPLIENLYDDWKKKGAASGFRDFNKLTLEAAARTPGEAGVAAQRLLTMVNDMAGEIGQVYMVGNTPTDHALQMASQNLKANWNEEQFKGALKLLKENITIRKGTISGIEALGAGGAGAVPVPGSAAPPAPSAAAAPASGPATAQKDPLGIR